MKIDTIRADFPILKSGLVYLDNAASSQKPQIVIDSLVDFYSNHYANIHRGSYSLSLQATEMYENARNTVKEFLNANYSEEIIFTSGCTESINLVSAVLNTFNGKLDTGWKLEKGDQIILSEMEHHANLVPWQILVKQKNLELKLIPVDENGELDLDIYKELLNPKVKIVAVTQVSNTIGTINPIQQIIKKAHDFGALVLIDGAQAVNHFKVDVSEAEADFYCFSGHKLFGPTGIGILYGKKNILDQLPPYRTGGDMVDTVTFTSSTFQPLPSKFEAGTPNISGAIGLAESIKYFQKISEQIVETETEQFSNILEYEKSLLEYATSKLLEIEGLKIIGQAKEKTGIISFIIKGVHPNDLGAYLDQKNICIRTGQHCTQPLLQKLNLPQGTARVSLAFYNTFEEIDKLLIAIMQALKILKS